MWRDVLTILAFVFTAFYYFGLTPRRLSEYARTAQDEVTKRALHQRIVLLIYVLASLVIIIIAVYRFDHLALGGVLVGIAMLAVIWFYMLTHVWKLAEKGEKIVSIVGRSVVLSLFIAGIVLSDMSPWQKVAYPIGGGCVGYGIALLQSYIRRKLESRRSSKERDK